MKEIFNNILKLPESINDKNLFKAVFLAGSSGSGKSFISDMLTGKEDSQLNLSPYGVKIIDSDKFFVHRLIKTGLSLNIDDKDEKMYALQTYQRGIAKALADKQVGFYMDGMLPLIIDGTGRSFKKVYSQAEALKSLGYDVSMVLVDVDLEVALARNTQRKRQVPEEVVIDANQGVKQNINNYAGYFGANNFVRIDNNKHLSPEEQKELANKMMKYTQKFITSPLKNPIGIQILEYMRDNKLKYRSEIGNIFSNSEEDDIRFKH